MDQYLSDIRQTVRFLRRNPGLVAVSVLSLGLGLGINFTLFTAIGAVFFHEPSVAAPDRVVGVEPGNSNQLSYLNYRDLRDGVIFEAVAGSRPVALNVRTGQDVEHIEGLAVTADFFQALGIPLALGGPFDPAEAAPEREPRVVVLSHRFWELRFDEDPRVIGRTLILNGERFTVTGVLPDRHRALTALNSPGVYVPISSLVLPTVADRSNANALGVLGRLRPGTTLEQARAAVTNLGRRLEQLYPRENAEMSEPARLVPLSRLAFGGSAEQFVVPAVLLTLFGLILLSACANVAGLLMARSALRQREIAVRLALGARRAQVIRLLLTESAGLAVLGALAGLLLSLWLMQALTVVALPGVGPLDISLTPDGSLAAYVAWLVAATALLCGLAPAWRATRPDVAAHIQHGDSHGMTGRLRLRHALVIGQVAACLILLVLSSLLLRSLMRITTLDPGFDLDAGVVARVHVDASRYAADGGLPLGERLVDRLEQLPGVESASFANIVALGADRSAARFQVEGRPVTEGARTFVNSVSPGYFATLGIPLLRGRDFDARDRQGGAPVAIVTEAFERTYLSGGDALGGRVRRSDTEPWAEIIGIASDHRYGSYSELPQPILYSAYSQRPQVSTQMRPVVVHVRASGPPAAVLQAVTQAIRAVDPEVSASVQTLREAAGSEPALRRFGSQLLASAGLLGLLLATIGLYGVMSFVVASRTPEIGMRMALGATAGTILRGVLLQGLRLVGVGVVAGAGVSWLAARAMAGFLAGVSPADPASFAVASAILAVVGLAACSSPARRAARVDPLAALRRL